jgi:hypothetical protein
LSGALAKRLWKSRQRRAAAQEKQPPAQMPSMRLWAALQRMLTPRRRQLWEKQTRARVMQPSARLLGPLKMLEP